MRTPTLHASDLVLQPLYHATKQQVDWLNDPINLQYSEQRHRIHTLASEQAYVRSFNQTSDHIWVIRREADSIAVGNITAHRDIHNQVAEIGILIDHPWWRQGYGIQAWCSVLDYLLTTMRKIEAGTRADNLGMRHLMERAGMFYEGERFGHFLDGHMTIGMVLYGKFK